ncbi:MAG: hypothetical protein LBQ96_08180 [Fusobacteriaceae bacterium]|jgi:type II secretory pathway pseudopilin PulG|nr:hypothetical protein [Fusobacteriaceae bacterium]
MAGNEERNDSRWDFGVAVIQHSLYVVAVALILAIIVVQIIRNITDVREQERAEETLKRLREIRLALELFYQKTQTYPDLTREGAADDLRILDYHDKDGNLISFAALYGSTKLAETPGNERINPSNAVRNVTDFKNAGLNGGWNYNYTERTGEIHANLPHDVYSQQIEWEEY